MAMILFYLPTCTPAWLWWRLIELLQLIIGKDLKEKNYVQGGKNNKAEGTERLTSLQFSSDCCSHC